MEEDVEQIIKRSNKRRWIIFGIMSAVVVAFAVVCVCLAFALEGKEITPDGNVVGFSFLAIAVTIIGGHLLFMTVDTLAVYHSALLKIVRTLLRIVGIIIPVPLNALLMLIVVDGLHGTNPWIIGLCTVGCLSATLTTLVYYWNKRVQNEPKGVDWKKYLQNNAGTIDRAQQVAKLYPYVPFISLVVAYFISVIFAYLGNAVHKFFSGWLVVILCLAAIIVSIVIFVKKFKRRGRRRARSSSSGGSSYAEHTQSVSDYNERKIDARHENGTKRMNNAIFGLRDFKYHISLPVGVERIEWEYDKGPEFYNKSFWISSQKVIVKYSVKCLIRQEYIDYVDDLCNQVCDRIADKITSTVEQVVNELVAEYSNYADKYEVACDFRCSYKIV